MDTEMSQASNNEELSERKKKITCMKIQRPVNCRQQIKADKKAFEAKNEMETVAAARERYDYLYFEY